MNAVFFSDFSADARLVPLRVLARQFLLAALPLHQSLFGGGTYLLASLARSSENRQPLRPRPIGLDRVGDDGQPRQAQPHRPRVCSLHEDRDVQHQQHRSPADEQVDPLPIDLRQQMEPLRIAALDWADAHLEALRASDPERPAGLGDRAFDNWKPLLAIADAAGGHWPATARRAAVALSAREKAEPSRSELLLADIRRVFDDAGADRLSSADLCKALRAVEDPPWRDMGLGPNSLAATLKPFEVGPKTIRIGETTAKGYRSEWFDDLWARYAPEK